MILEGGFSSIESAGVLEFGGAGVLYSLHIALGNYSVLGYTCNKDAYSDVRSNNAK